MSDFMHYVVEETRGRKLHLIKMPNKINSKRMYLDATKRVREAIEKDVRMGYKNGGPSMGQEVQKAKEYASYVMTCANSDNMHYFSCSDYKVFMGATGAL